MTFTFFAAILFAVVSTFCTVKCLLKEKKPLRVAFANTFFGVASLGVVNLFAIYTGVSIAVNYVTAFMSVVLGAPGVICVLLLRILFLPQ